MLAWNVMPDFTERVSFFAHAPGSVQGLRDLAQQRLLVETADVTQDIAIKSDRAGVVLRC
jgi:hypothetical protein